MVEECQVGGEKGGGGIGGRVSDEERGGERGGDRVGGRKSVNTCIACREERR